MEYSEIKPFVDNVNAEMPNRPSIPVPVGGSLTAGTLLSATGVGMGLVQTTDVGFKPAGSIYVSLTDSKADYTDINDAIVYAKTIANTSYPTIIFVDKGVYELKDCDISDVDLNENKLIYIKGVGKSPSTYWDYYWGTSTNHFNSTQIVLNVYGAGYGLKTLKAIISFYDCELKLLNSPDVLTTNLSGDGFYMSSGMLIFTDCRIVHATSQGTGNGILNFIKGVNGVSAHFYNTSIQNVIVGFGSLSYSFIDFTSATHPNLFILGCTIHLKPSTTKTTDFTFYNAVTSNYDNNITQTRIENNFITCSQIQDVVKTLVFWKGNHPNPAGKYVVKNNSFDMKITALRSLPTWIWFDYDTNSIGGNIELMNNSFLNSNDYLPNTYISRLDTNDTLFFTDNLINGTVIKMLGTGTFQEAPIHLGITVPLSGNLDAGLPLVPTGVGLNVLPSKDFGFKPTGSVYVSLTDPKADYANINDAIVYAKTVANTSYPIIIFVDKGTYEITDCDISDVDLGENKPIVIRGVNPAPNTAYDYNFSSLYKYATTININPYGATNIGLKTLKCMLSFFNCFIQCNPSDVSKKDVTGSGFYLSSGSISFTDCWIDASTGQSSGVGVITFIQGINGVSAHLFNTFINCKTKGSYTTACSFINFTASTHPSFYMVGCRVKFFRFPTASVNDFTFYNARNTNYDNATNILIENNYIACTGLIAGGIYTFVKYNDRVVESRFIVRNNQIVSTLTTANTCVLTWFDYNTLNGTGYCSFSYNTVTNNLSSVTNFNLFTLGTGDHVILRDNSFTGLVIKDSSGVGIIDELPIQKYLNSAWHLTPVEVGFKPKDSVFVSATNPLADFTDLGLAIIYAKTNWTTTYGSGAFSIYVDSGSYTVQDVDISAVGVIDTAIRIVGASPAGDQKYSAITTGPLSKTKITINGFGATNYAIKAASLYLIFEDCEIYSSAPTTTALTGYGFYFSSGGVWFIDCKMSIIPIPSSSGTGRSIFIGLYSSTGMFVSFLRCYCNVVTPRGTANDTYSVIDLSNSSHPYLFMNDSEFLFTCSIPLFNSASLIFFNGANADTSSTPYSQCRGNKITINTHSAYAKTIIFWKAVAIGSTTKANIFERNAFFGSCASATGKIQWFDYDTIPGTGKLYLTYNSFINLAAVNSINVSNAGVGDTIYLSNNTYQGLMTKMIGSGSLSLSADEEILEGKVILDEAVADGYYSGICFKATVDTGVVFGDVLYLDPSDNIYKKANATTSTTAPSKVVSIEGAGSAKRVMRSGFIRSSAKFSFTAGADIYLSTSAGLVTATKPSASGNIVQLLGWAHSADCIYFEPDQTYLELL